MERDRESVRAFQGVGLSQASYFSVDLDTTALPPEQSQARFTASIHPQSSVFNNRCRSLLSNQTLNLFGSTIRYRRLPGLRDRYFKARPLVHPRRTIKKSLIREDGRPIVRRKDGVQFFRWIFMMFANPALLPGLMKEAGKING